MLSRLRSDRLMPGICNHTSRRWSSEPVEPSLKRGVCYGLLLSLPLWGLILQILF
jgi:hypothetical protein